MVHHQPADRPAPLVERFTGEEGRFPPAILAGAHAQDRFRPQQRSQVARLNGHADDVLHRDAHCQPPLAFRPPQQPLVGQVKPTWPPDSDDVGRTRRLVPHLSLRQHARLGGSPCHLAIPLAERPRLCEGHPQ